MAEIVGKDITSYYGDAKSCNGLAAEKSPSEANGIPGTAEAFARWWEKQTLAGNVSGFLPEAAERAYLTLKSIELNREPFKSHAFTEACAKDLADFARLWADHTKGEG